MPQPVQDVSTAYRYCLELARSHYENFPTASLLIPRRLRPAVAAIYAFARHADDIADEGDAAQEVRLKQLDAWEALLERCMDTPVDHPIFIALADSIRCHRLPIGLFHDLITAYRMDVSIQAYASLDELLFYCRHSANPVGRLILALHGIRDTQAVAASDALCTALQLTNFWQDLGVDVTKGRCYLAEEWLAEAGLSSRQVLGGEATAKQLQPALALAYSETEIFYRHSRQLLARLPPRLRLNIAATWHGGHAILRAVQGLDDSLHIRPSLNGWHWWRLTPLVVRDALFPPALTEATP